MCIYIPLGYGQVYLISDEFSVEYNLESNFKLECSRDIYTLH